jgi:hypothetical protein
MTSLEQLIAALRVDAHPDGWSQQTAAADADKLVVSALVLGMAPLLHWQLSQWNVTLPPRALAKLAAAHQASLTRQQAIAAQLRELVCACARESLPIIVLKGAYLAEFVYPEQGLRPMNDIDVLLQPSHLPQVEALLKRLGYEGHYKSAAEGARIVKHTSTFRKPQTHQSTPNPYLSAESERTIEPHTSLEESWFGLRADITDGVWERSIEIDYHGQPARALCLSDLMLHLCLHLTFHLIMGFPSIVQLLDLRMVSARLSSNDWDEMLRRARERNVMSYLYAALRLAHLTLAAPVPVMVLRELAAATPARVRAHAETLSLRDVMRRTQQPPLTTIAQRLQRGAQDRAETARWATTWGEWWNVWRTLLDVAKTDTGKIIGQRIKQAVRSEQ